MGHKHKPSPSVAGINKAASTISFITVTARGGDVFKDPTTLVETPKLWKRVPEVLTQKEIDAMKFQSCLTLFFQIAPQDLLLQAALHRFFGDKLDSKTLEIIKKTL